MSVPEQSMRDRIIRHLLHLRNPRNRRNPGNRGHRGRSDDGSAPLDHAEDLRANGLIDSLSLVDFVLFVEREFACRLPPEAGTGVPR